MEKITPALTLCLPSNERAKFAIINPRDPLTHDCEKRVETTRVNTSPSTPSPATPTSIPWTLSPSCQVTQAVD